MHLQTLELFSTDPEGMLLFYRDKLECTVQVLNDAFLIRTATTELVFRQSIESQPVYHFAFTIPWHQVQEALLWTGARVPLLELAPGQHIADFRNWNAQAFYFFDPAGNIVEFIAREPLGIQSSEPFSGRTIHSVSEVGLVTDNVPLACRQLEELWDVPIFAKQPPSANFAAAGDDNGLFIVVSEGRPWYPTNITAMKAPLTATFLTKKGNVQKLHID